MWIKIVKLRAYLIQSYNKIVIFMFMKFSRLVSDCSLKYQVCCLCCTVFHFVGTVSYVLGDSVNLGTFRV